MEDCFTITLGNVGHHESGKDAVSLWKFDFIEAFPGFCQAIHEMYSINALMKVYRLTPALSDKVSGLL